MGKKVLVVGSGGREHALCWKLAQSPQVEQVFCAPGNGGTAQEAKTENIPIAPGDFVALIHFAKTQQVDLTVIGPDNPLADGIADAFQAEGLQVFGPTREAARLESSKVFAKQFMRDHGIPTARFEVFEAQAEALAFCRANPWARVVKVDGLALGKGVYVCDTLEACEQALAEIFENRRFGQSGSRVVVEERLQGPEVSLMVLCDGKTMRPMASSQDYKRRFNDNRGPNTGGMGAYSPVPNYGDYQARVAAQVLVPLEAALKDAPFTYQGVLYVGLLIQDGEPYVLEFNARFGDPETQCLLPRLQNDLYELFVACVQGTLEQQELIWTSKSAVCVVACAESYPEQGSRDVPITLGPVPSGVIRFHAGTRREEEGALVTNGGRVLNVVGMADTLEDAVKRAYQGLDAVRFEGMAFRTDIAKDARLCLLK